MESPESSSGASAGITYRVTVEGAPAEFLDYPDTFSPGPAGQEKPCVVRFRPLAQGKWDARVKFYSEALGEFWYELGLECTSVPVEEVALEAQVGTGVEQAIRVQNPFPTREINYELALSNPEAFQVSPKRFFRLQAFEETNITVTYRPSKVNEAETATLSVIGRDTVGTVFQQL